MKTGAIIGTIAVATLTALSFKKGKDNLNFWQRMSGKTNPLEGRPNKSLSSEEVNLTGASNFNASGQKTSGGIESGTIVSKTKRKEGDSSNNPKYQCPAGFVLTKNTDGTFTCRTNVA